MQRERKREDNNIFQRPKTVPWGPRPAATAAAATAATAAAATAAAVAVAAVEECLNN